MKQLVSNRFKEKFRFNPEVLQERPRLSHLLAIIGVGCVMVVTSWIWIHVRERFPKLAHGYYYGYLQVPQTAKDLQKKDFLFISAKDNEFVIQVFDSDFPTQLTSSDSRNDEDDSKWVHPLMVMNDEGQVKLTGTVAGPGLYSGQARYFSDDLKANWELKSIAYHSHTDWRLNDNELLSWVNEYSQLKKLAKSVDKLKTAYEKQIEENERLSEFITDPASLRERAEKRYVKVQQEHTELKKKYDQLAGNARRLRNQVALAQKVTRQGTLVSLARESLEREGRWVESMFQSDRSATGETFSQSVDRAERIMELRRQIAIEREQLSNLRMIQERKSGVSEGRKSFENIWGGR